jgi:methylmalonyl-CoA mutase
MSPFLFSEFKGTTPVAWKQKIQVDLKGLEYNETLLWKTEEDIVVKPFYNSEDRKQLDTGISQKTFATCQSIFVDDERIANELALDALKRGANAIQFIAKNTFNSKVLLKNIDLNSPKIFFKLEFLDVVFTENLSKYFAAEKSFFQIDIISNLAESGNWYQNLETDISKFNLLSNTIKNSICIDASLYENAGAGMVQQLAYTLAHANEYLNRLENIDANNIHFIFSVRGNYFFEIAKLRAFRILFKSLLYII